MSPTGMTILFLLFITFFASASGNYYFDEKITLKQDSFETTSWVSLALAGPGTLSYNVTCLDGSSEISVMLVDKHNLDRYLSGMTFNHYSEYSMMMVRLAILNATLVNITTDLYLVIENMNLFSSIVVSANIQFLNIMVTPESSKEFYLPVGVVAGLVVLIVILVIIAAIAIFVIVRKKKGYIRVESGAVLEVSKDEQRA